MRVPMFIGLTLLLLGGLFAQEGGAKIQSGVKVGDVLPGPFDAYNVNGKTAKGRQHCLVCDFGLSPVVMVFAREPAEGKDGPLMSLLSKLDDAVGRYLDDRNLGSFAIFLEPGRVQLGEQCGGAGYQEDRGRSRRPRRAGQAA